MGGGLQAARRWPRLPQVTCHELCHLLGLGNCRWLRCLMQGALRVDEALRRPLDLCPICLRKLQHLLGFRLVDRYKVSGRGRNAVNGRGRGGNEVSGRGRADTSGRAGPGWVRGEWAGPGRERGEGAGPGTVRGEWARRGVDARAVTPGTFGIRLSPRPGAWPGAGGCPAAEGDRGRQAPLFPSNSN